jgi:pyridoxine/pyridoxamine 5'-phosphate oxidase
MIEKAFETLKTALFNGIHKKGHPFRYFTLATINGDMPQQRTVVLRKISEDLKFTFYTDSRSPKIEQMQTNKNVSLLFYHPKKLIQIKVDGKATLINDKEELNTYWHGIPAHARKDYTTSNPPGSINKTPDTISYLDEENYFGIVEIDTTSIEYLKLQKPNHQRVLFTKTEENWAGEFLVP